MSLLIHSTYCRNSYVLYSTRYDTCPPGIPHRRRTLWRVPACFVARACTQHLPCASSRLEVQRRQVPPTTACCMRDCVLLREQHSPSCLNRASACMYGSCSCADGNTRPRGIQQPSHHLLFSPHVCATAHAHKCTSQLECAFPSNQASN